MVCQMTALRIRPLVPRKKTKKNLHLICVIPPTVSGWNIFHLTSWHVWHILKLMYFNKCANVETLSCQCPNFYLVLLCAPEVIQKGAMMWRDILKRLMWIAPSVKCVCIFYILKLSDCVWFCVFFLQRFKKHFSLTSLHPYITQGLCHCSCLLLLTGSE